MPFGLGKSDKLPENEGDPVIEEVSEEGQETGAADTESTDPFPDGQSEPTSQAQEEASESMAFRPTFLNSDAPSEPTPAAQPPEGDVFFVSVSKDGGVETHRFDRSSQAQTFVEELLEEGVAQEQVAAFSGHRVALRVTSRPVVRLVASQDN